ncbi:BAG family molecular chaperone regulator 1-like isoform X2 [Ptychodera flava]|uniref:BAG family molecular chaperone regulator 1-like isoform X2 n=1 Tax=Ptychodera flava TaxID=63121 RepID=UPI003969C1AA
MAAPWEKFSVTVAHGKSLSDPEQSLLSAGLKEGCKVMMIGRKSNPEEDANRSMVSEEEKKAEITGKKQKAVEEELDGIEKGFLQKNLIREAYAKLLKRLAICNEEYMRILEKLDSMTVPEDQRSVRSNKKDLIKRIQVCLDRNDELKARITDGMTKTQSL